MNWILKGYLKLHRRYHNQIIAKHGAALFEGLHPKNVFHYRSEFFQENVTSKDVVIDLACGTGTILYHLRNQIRLGIGVDLDGNNIRTCKTKRSADNLRYLQKNIFEIDYPALHQETSYNVAVFSHILEHLNNPIEIIQKVNAPKLLICVPSQENWHKQLLKHLEMPYFSDDSHFREYTRAMLRSEVEEAGYAVKELGFNAEGEIICRAEQCGSA